MIQRTRVVGVALVLLLLIAVLSACGATPVAETWPGLTVADGVVYVISGSPQQVYVLDAESGVQKTTFLPPGEHKGVLWWSPVTLGEELAYVGFSEPQAKAWYLYAFDPETGQQQWQAPAEDLILAAPAYGDGVVYFGTTDGRVHAVDGENGAGLPGWPFTAEEAIWASPLVAGDQVYVASMDHHLYCLDAESGALEWSFEAGGALAAQPVLEDGIVYVGAFDGRVYAIQADTGEPVAGFDFKAENWIWSEVLLADGTLFVSSLDGKLYALDPTTGAAMPGESYEAGGPLRAAPVKAGEAIIVADDTGKVTALRAGTAQMLWQWPSGTPEASVLTTPVVWQDMVFAVPVNGQVQALAAENGAQGWAFSPPGGQ